MHPRQRRALRDLLEDPSMQAAFTAFELLNTTGVWITREQWDGLLDR